MVMNLKLSYTAGAEDEAKTVKLMLKYRLGLSERLVKRLKYAGQVLCNSIPVHVDHRVKSGDIIEALVEFDEQNENIIPEEIGIDVIYEDESLIAVNKQAGLVVHPTSYHPSGTIANALAYRQLRQGRRTLIRPVSRLDRGTSGIIVFASNQYVQERLIRQMADGVYRKEYIGVVYGTVKEKKGRIELPIARKPGSIMLREINSGGAPSVTCYELIEALNNASCLRFELETGRTHQIRVHCQAIGHPLIGDTLYPPPGTSMEIPEPGIDRQALHSFRTCFSHPVTGKPLELVAPLPPDILHVLEILRK
jgi:23S rRNA pseudouridine1911/1915/1917 synthase